MNTPLARYWNASVSPWVGLRDGPQVLDDGRTPQHNLWVAGDLADATVIKAALIDGHEVGERIAAAITPHDGDVDVVIVGAGPAGCAAAAALMQRGATVRLLDRDRAFATLSSFPRGKVLYAEPRDVTVPGPFAFEDATAEDLVTAWRSTIQTLGLDLQEHCEVLDLERNDGCYTVSVSTRHGASQSLDTLTAQHVLIAMGRRGTPRTLDVPGETLPQVAHTLDDPTAYAHQEVLVIGGGDSAVEAALALSHAGSRVTLVHRKASFDRPKVKNLDALDDAIARGALQVRTETQLVEVTPGGARLQTRAVTEPVSADAVFVLVGTRPPEPFLKRIGLHLKSEVPWSEVMWVMGWVAATWLFYLIKTGRRYFPLGPNSADWIHDALKVPVAWFPTVDGSVRVLDGGFWGTLLYTLLIVVFGALAIRRHGPAQRNRYLSLMGFQAAFLFGIPEILAPMVTASASGLYGLSVPWPLRLDSLIVSPDTAAAGLWLALGGLTSFVALPLFIRWNNERFCSWMCGCGGLAETLGDVWRWKAPRGMGAKQAEWAGRAILLLAIPITLMALADAWKLVGYNQWLDQPISIEQGVPVVSPIEVPEREGYMRITEAALEEDRLVFSIEKFDWDGQWRANGWTNGINVNGTTVYAEQVREGTYALPIDPTVTQVVVRASSSALSNATNFARAWYGLMVDFVLASVLGVAAYPIFGNRVWCRFFCPLRAYMEHLSRWFGRLAIVADDRCISCGACTADCQMGIDVQGFAEKQVTLDNVNSACIQCGVCVEVCPMDVLTLVDKPTAGLTDGPKHPRGPRW